MREAIALIRKLWTEERVTFEGQYYRTENATIYDKPEQTRCRSTSPAPAPWWRSMPAAAGDGFICTSGKKRELYTETLLPNVAEGIKAARQAQARLRPDDRDEGVVRHRPGSARWTIPGTGRRWR